MSVSFWYTMCSNGFWDCVFKYFDELYLKIICTNTHRKVFLYVCINTISNSVKYYVNTEVGGVTSK